MVFKSILSWFFFLLYSITLKPIGGEFVTKEYFKDLENMINNIGGRDVGIKAPWYYEIIIRNAFKKSGIAHWFIFHDEGKFWFSVELNEITLSMRENLR